MSELNEIDYRVLIDRVIQDFRPIKRLAPIGVQLLLWSLLGTAILVLSALLNWQVEAGAMLLFHNYGFDSAGFMLLSVAAAWMALRNSIPGRETSAGELIILAVGIIAAALLVRVEPLTHSLLSSNDLRSTLSRHLGFAALPWLTLFWAVRRAVPLRPRLTGGMIGLAASCFAIAAGFLSGPTHHSFLEQLLAGAFLTGLSVVAGGMWLDPERLWRTDHVLAVTPPNESARLERIIFTMATALAAGLLFFVLKAGTGTNNPIPDFDLAIENYQQSLINFRPNVPSSSLETILTAYIERGMPSYMWDFDSQGFKLMGGRYEHLSDGTPVTYTWFRGAKAGVMCMFRQTSGFQAPPGLHFERHHLLFYRYRGYSVCLINVGGYGDFISVIVSPTPMKPFMRLVLSALSAEQH